MLGKGSLSLTLILIKDDVILIKDEERAID